ncbi:outer membrane beta-barrel protein [Cytophagaceae bacterium YF14B1]|uniref:Outer membrane beta-barrel protein n=1 Tax=Xanthocytophaga flava TaxID=3048013 RepID=A0AAE3QU29_9BACT|nr:outer membrane beta-barrel protein [Xanthocytophaga flavus]MDJ1483388.1 outer membrane beta-barrel protein [Xanthocytophaga flavus]
MLKFLSLVVVLLLSTVLLHAQVIVRGQVMDSNHTPVYLATVRLSTEADSLFLTGVQTDSAGMFEFRGLQTGHYRFQVSLLGHQAYVGLFTIHPEQATIQLETIVMAEDPKQLEEVIVKGERNAIRYEPMKTVIQVAGNSLFKSSSNILDILRKAPGLTVDPDGSILVSGRNTPAIFINGKPVPMSVEESLAYLKALSPDMIESIDLIANPSAQYDGQYKAIIDIKLRQNQSLGWKGLFNSAFRQNMYSSSDNTLNVAYRSKRATYTLRTGYVAGDDYYLYTALQHLANTNIMATHTHTRTINNNLNLQATVDYTIHPQHTIEVSLKTYRANRNATTANQLSFREPVQYELLDVRQTINKSVPVQLNDALNAAYTLTFSKNSRLNLFGSLTNIRNRQNEDIQIRNQFSNERTNYWKTTLKNTIAIRNIQADYSQNMQSGNLQAGAKLAIVRTNNDLRYDTLNTEQQFVPDAGRTNRFTYDEYIHAGYISYGHKRNKLDMRVSLRTEYTRTIANSVLQNTVRKREYITWLPGINASYELGQDHRISLNANRRITRPDFSQLNPFRFYYSPLNYWVGNPYLRPSVTTSANLSYAYHAFTVGITAGREKDYMVRYPEYNRTTNELLYLGTNLPYADFANLETSYGSNLTQWWKMTHNLGIYYLKQQMPYLGKVYAIGVTDFSINGSHVFTLPKGVTADLTYRYQSKGGSSLYVRKAFGSADIGLQKSWLKDKLNTRLTFYDIFYTHAYKLVFREKEIIDNQLAHRYATRRLVFTLVYNFGTGNYTSKDNRTTDEEKRAK